jgi:transcriptional regulator with XRE-family HTH domain
MRQLLARRRRAVGLTQEALAALLDVDRSTVARWERGETEPLPWIRPKLGKSLRVTADRLDELLATGATGAPQHAACPAREPARTAPWRGCSAGRRHSARRPEFTVTVSLRFLTARPHDAECL